MSLGHLVRIYFSRLVKELSAILPIGLLIILLANLLAPQSQFDVAKQNVLEHPADPRPHAFLARQFFATNQFTKAQVEARLANDQNLLQQIQDINSQPEKVKKDIALLQKIIAQLPNYRDAYIRLAILNWKLSRPFDAQKYLEKALEIDPNNEVATTLSSLLLEPPRP